MEDGSCFKRRPQKCGKVFYLIWCLLSSKIQINWDIFSRFCENHNLKIIKQYLQSNNSLKLFSLIKRTFKEPIF